MSKKLNNEVLLGGFIVIAGGLLAYMSIAVGGLNMTPGVHITARFSNASGLVKDAMVSVAGVQVGHIESLEVDHDKAVVHIFVRKDAMIRKDVQATIRAKSLLGEKYLELEPQSRNASPMQDGDQIAVTHPSVEVDEVLAALGPVIRKVDPNDIATIVHVAATTLDGQKGNLQDIMKHATSVASQVDDLVRANHGNINKAAASLASMSANGDALLKAKRPEIEHAVTSVDHLTGVLDKETPSLMAKGQRIATHVASMTTSLDRETPHLLRSAKSTLSHADAALVKVPGTLETVDNTLRKTGPLLDKANKITPGGIEDAAHRILARDGIQVFVHPFGPSEDDYRKMRQQDDLTRPSTTPTTAANPR